jgi:uncharacterized protein
MLAVLLVIPARVVRGETVAGLPKPTGYVNDFAGVMSPETVQSLEDLCTQVDQKAHAQIAVVTIKSIDPDKSGATPTIEEFATALEDKWKVGAKGTDKGVLMIFVMTPPPVHGRIEVGYGLEGILNDAKVGDIGRAMKPILVSGDINKGVTLGVQAIAQDIAADAGVTLDTGGEPAAEYHYENSAPEPDEPTGGDPHRRGIAGCDCDPDWHGTHRDPVLPAVQLAGRRRPGWGWRGE